MTTRKTDDANRPPAVGAPATRERDATVPASLRFVNWGFRHASRRRFAVRGLNLDIHAGQRVLLLGASGIGKSTILQAATGILGGEGKNEPSSDGTIHGVEDADGGMSEGSILVDGVPAVQARGRVGLVLQDPDSQTVFQRLGDNVAFGPENLGVPRDRIWSRVDESLEQVGLGGIQLHRSTAHLSGGQTQRLALAGVLSMRPGALLLDEPTANLDPDGVDQVVAAVAGVLDSTKATMLLVEHRAQPWIDVIDRVVVLGVGDDRDSRNTGVVADGTPDEVFSDDAIDFAGLGIWVPERYRRDADRIGVVHVPGEPPYSARVGTGDPILCAEELVIGRSGSPLARPIDLSFRAGQITALVGANGAGKSTLSLTLAGLLPPLDGEVTACGGLADGLRDTHPLSWSSRELAARISYVFQNPEHQFAKGTVLDEVMLGPLRTGMDEARARSWAEGLLDRFNLRRYARANPYTLSGGEKRRLTVAAALAAVPKVLILDEPTFGQDRRTWTQMVELIRGLRSDGVSIIVVTHDRDLVQALDARVVEMVPHGASREWGRGDCSDLESGYASADAVDPLGDGPRPGDVSHAVDVPQGASDRMDRAASMRGPRDGGHEGRETRIEVTPVNRRVEEERRSSRSRYLASLNPSIRLIGAFVVSLPLLLSLDVVSASVALGFEIVLLWAVGYAPWHVARSCWPLIIGAPGSALAVLLYGKSGGDVWWSWALITISDRSAALAVATAVRILAVGIPAIVMVLGVDATDLADSFSQILHLPDRFVYGGLAGMRLFSVLRDDWSALTASRRSRGLGDDNAVRAFLPQAFALLVLSIRRSTTLAVAMEARGFGGSTPRTHARVSVVTSRDHLFLVVCAMIPLVSLLAAWRCGSFAFLGG
ncbi:ATP-binding cassette domain-containing protein [uncultured Bifidobacterium sp.]|uniref:ATP-binding cassette domain-containing protein n=1 Tax=uncultured Bifidobacterium sp. TaxID=165187 RepID=UPI00262BB381|nr:ATP-binding cassette domain-containing protein [uncultured Bifidobacterium sp.]